METFLSRMRTLFVVLVRCGLFALTVTALVLFFASVWLEQFLRQVTPLMLAGLPPHHRRILLRMAESAPSNTTMQDDAAE